MKLTTSPDLWSFLLHRGRSKKSSKGKNGSIPQKVYSSDGGGYFLNPFPTVVEHYGVGCVEVKSESDKVFSDFLRKKLEASPAFKSRQPFSDHNLPASVLSKQRLYSNSEKKAVSFASSVKLHDSGKKMQISRRERRRLLAAANSSSDSTVSQCNDSKRDFSLGDSDLSQSFDSCVSLQTPIDSDLKRQPHASPVAASVDVPAPSPVAHSHGILPCELWSATPTAIVKSPPLSACFAKKWGDVDEDEDSVDGGGGVHTTRAEAWEVPGLCEKTG